MKELNVGKIKDVLLKNDVEFAGVFGSYARGDDGSDSDIDLMVRFRGETPGLFGFIFLEKQLSDILGRKVDLVTEQSVHPYLKSRVLKDLKIIYGANLPISYRQ